MEIIWIFTGFFGLIAYSDYEDLQRTCKRWCWVFGVVLIIKGLLHLSVFLIEAHKKGLL